MKKKYQVFISSTYKDLKKERLKVRDAVLSLYQFPVGMEMFGAVSDNQWSVIQRDIDESDCYVLIIGKLFGSEVPDEGISYTQKEFRYARDKGIPIFAFIIEDDADVPKTFKETEIKRINKLRAFISEVENGRTVAYWSNADKLATLVTSSLARFISNNPKGGWIKEECNNVKLSDEIERHDATYITINGNQDIRYCSRCYDVDHKLVQLNCFEGSFQCPNCKNNGVYDREQVQAFSKRINEKSTRRVISKGFDIYGSFS